MTTFVVFFKSNIFLKAIMAVSGLLMVGFLCGHMAGNLLIFAGAEALNDYAYKLHSMPLMLWSVRIGLLISVFVHILSAIILTKRNRQARSGKYSIKNRCEGTLASFNMGLTGSLILLYIIFHLAHFTFKLTHPEFKNNPSDIYSMVVSSFESPIISSVYILSMILIAVHLYHGIASAFDSLGLYHSKYQAIIKYASLGLSTLLALGFISVPTSILIGLIS